MPLALLKPLVIDRLATRDSPLASLVAAYQSLVAFEKLLEAVVGLVQAAQVLLLAFEFALEDFAPLQAGEILFLTLGFQGHQVVDGVVFHRKVEAECNGVLLHFLQHFGFLQHGERQFGSGDAFHGGYG